MPPSQSRKRKGRPPRPPPPPASLVRLLRNDPDVHAYFAALQDSLEADVQVWKERAFQAGWDKNGNHKRNTSDGKSNGKNTEKPTGAVSDTAPSKKRAKGRPRANGTTTSASAKGNPKHNKPTNEQFLYSDTSDDDQDVRKTPPKRPKTALHKAAKKNNNPTLHLELESSSSDENGPEDDDVDDKNSDAGGTSRLDNHRGVKDDTHNASDTQLHTQGQEITDDVLSFPSDSSDEEDKNHNGDDNKDRENNGRHKDDEIKLDAAKNGTHEQLSPEKYQGDGSGGDDDDDLEIVDRDSPTHRHNTKSKSIEQTSRKLPHKEYYDEVYELLNELGFCLVVTENVPVEEDVKDDKDDKNQASEEKQQRQQQQEQQQQQDQSPPQPTTRRRTNDEVYREVKSVVEFVCRHASTEQEMLTDRLPFSSGQPVSCLSGNEHIIRVAFDTTFRFLLLLDTFTEQWKGAELEDRQELLPLVEKRLQDEVLHDWPTKDRLARLTEHNSIFEPDLEMDWDSEKMDQNEGKDEKESVVVAAHSFDVSVRSLSKLLLLVERAGWAQILVGIYLSRNDLESAVALVRNYILLTVPSQGQENALYPRLAPVLSFVVLEAMVKTDWRQMGKEFATSHNPTNLFSHVWGEASGTDNASSVYSVNLYRAASIWKQRAESRKDKIRHVAKMEYAAYARLCHDCCLPMQTQNYNPKDMDAFDTISWNLVSPPDIAIYQLYLVGKGSSHISSLTWISGETRDYNLQRISCWFEAIRHLYLRRYGETKAAVGTKVALNRPVDPLLDHCKKQLALLWESTPFDTNSVDRALVLATLLNAAATLSDGDSVVLYGGKLLALLQKMKIEEKDWKLLRPVWEIVCNVSQRPLAHVINLRRRHDRWEFMVHQAMKEQFLMIRGVGDLSGAQPMDHTSLSKDAYAFDGEWPTSKLLEYVGTRAHLAKLVRKDWLPLHLAPFDRDAPKVEKSVPMHPSEVACALSHIATWKTCNRVLTIDVLQPSTEQSSTGRSGLVRQPDTIRQAWHIAGYARGPPLRWQNGGLPPTPVCLVLEDDAHVEHGFCEKLDALLAELPRDFHYCALGYGRPKSAPIFRPWPSRPCIGIPSHLFFATGYLVSFSGLEYLKEHSPVQGPIDAWLGLLQTKNFDNLTGQRLGVGSHGKGGGITSNQVAKLMDFMAYCAVPMLCQQPLGKHAQNATPGRGRRWKEKDTDITYSGHKNV